MSHGKAVYPEPQLPPTSRTAKGWGWLVFAAILLLAGWSLGQSGFPIAREMKARGATPRPHPMVEIIWDDPDGTQSGGTIRNISTQPITGLSIWFSRLPDWNIDLPVSDSVAYAAEFGRWGDKGLLLYDPDQAPLPREMRVLNPGEEISFFISPSPQEGLRFPVKMEVNNGHPPQSEKYKRIPYQQRLGSEVYYGSSERQITR